MRSRVRHCIPCPHCRTRYLIGFSPYANGAYVVFTRVGCLEECLLYCPCRRFALPSRWGSSDIRTCKVSKSVYRRGFGSSEEVIFADQQAEPIGYSPTSVSRDFAGRKMGGQSATHL
jgi:hypothetical protein